MLSQSVQTIDDQSPAKVASFQTSVKSSVSRVINSIFRSIDDLNDVILIRKKQIVCKNISFDWKPLLKTSINARGFKKIKHISKLTVQYEDRAVNNIKHLKNLLRVSKHVSFKPFNYNRISSNVFPLDYNLNSSRITTASFDFTAIKHIIPSRLQIKFGMLKNLRLSYDRVSNFLHVRNNSSRLRRLNSLRIKAHQYGGFEEEFVQLCSTLKQFKSLYDIYLNMDDHFGPSSLLPSFSLVYILDALKLNKSIRSLDLKIQGCAGGDSMITCEYALRGLNELLNTSCYSNLEVINLDLSIYHKCNSQSLEILGEALGRQELLRELHVIFSERNNFKDQSVFKFTKELSKLQNLSKLSLSLPQVHHNIHIIFQALGQILDNKLFLFFSSDNLFSYTLNNQTSVELKVFSNVSKDCLSILSSEDLILKAFNAACIELDCSKNKTIQSVEVAIFIKSILEARSPQTLLVKLPGISEKVLKQSVDSKSHRNKEKNNLTLEINNTKVQVFGDNNTLALFASGLAVYLSSHKNLQKLIFDFAKTLPLQGDIISSVADLFNSCQHVKERIIIFSKIEPDPSSKFKVTSALAQINQCGGQVIMASMDSSGDGGQSKTFNELLKTSRFSEIDKVDLKFKSNDIMPYLTFDILKRNINKVTNLESISLDFGEVADFGTAEDFESLELLLNQSHNLAYFALNLAECNCSAAMNEVWIRFMH